MVTPNTAIITPTPARPAVTGAAAASTPLAPDADFDALLEEVESRLAEMASSPEEDEWGYVVRLDVGDRFKAWFRRQETAEGHFGPQPVYLLLDSDGRLCRLYGGRLKLDEGFDNANPAPGDKLVIARAPDSASGRHNYIVHVGHRVPERAIAPTDFQASAPL
jgi:hypothetical protein